MKKYSINMFQVPPLMVFEYEGDLNKDLDYVTNIEYTSTHSPLSSRSKNDYILDDDNLKELKQFCLDSIHEYVNEVLGTDHEIAIQQSWVNMCNTGQHLYEHYHPNSFISGVFYFASDQEKGSPITFSSELHKSNFSVQKLSDNENSYYPSIAQRFQHPSIPGQLLLFSSTTSHQVQVNESDKDRISLSFNTYPKLPFGNEWGLNMLTVP
tara:strand:+ start:99 stop:728 length:630 start_codon:yes stop_codon:yes gene_type:complete